MMTDTTGVLDRDAVDARGRAVPLSELDDFEVADGYPEIRGWDVRDSGGRSIGYVYDLLVDVEALRVRYLDVELDAEFAGAGAERRVLVPLESVGLDGQADDVLLRIDAADVHALVPYARRGVTREATMPVTPAAPLADFDDASTRVPAGLTHDLPGDVSPLVADSGATATRGAETDANFYGERHYDDARLFARDEAPPAAGALAAGIAAEGIVRSEHEVAIGGRKVGAGDVGVRRVVEIEPIIENLPVAREDVDIERRALLPGEDLRAPSVEGDEIRIPIMAEELVIEKRLVTKEVLIIRRRSVTEQRAVEADLRRERVEIDDPAGRVRGADSSSPAADAGPV